jgi:hypothetical protein
MEAKNRLSNLQAVEIPQDTAVNLANGLVIKPIPLDFSTRLDNILVEQKSYFDKLIAKESAIRHYNYGLRPVHIQIYLYARFYTRHYQYKLFLTPLRLWNIRRQIRKKLSSLPP